MRRLSYNPALDGVRAVAVLAVIMHHMDALDGGYVGVDIFLVLSGFLITSLLLEELAATGTLSIRAFYVRRAYRLLPAFYALVALGAVLVVLTKPEARQLEYLQSALSTLFYYNNYRRAFSIDGADSSWFGHAWSLSLEEQFYLFWPAVLVVIWRCSWLRRQLPLVLLGAALLVCIWRELLIAQGAHALRLYFGTDTRADALFIGCALGALRHQGFSLRGSRVLATSFTRMRAPLVARVASLAPLALLCLVAIAWQAPDVSVSITWLDHGGYTLVALLAAVLVLAVDLGSPSWLTRALASGPLSGIGRISYGLYLWHFPVTTICLRLVSRLGLALSVVLAIAVSIGVAYLSAYLLERPIMRRRPAWTQPSPRASDKVEPRTEPRDPGPLVDRAA